MLGLEAFAPQVLCASSDASTTAAAANNSTHTTTLSYPNWDGGHPPLRGSPDYPYGHPGYFNGTHAADCPGYTGGPTDSYGQYSGAGGMAADPNSTTSLNGMTTADNTTSLAPALDKNAPDYTWQRGYSWCGMGMPNTESGCTPYTAQEVAVVPPVVVQDGADHSLSSDGIKVPANPGHLMMCGHAALFGALDATTKLVTTGSFDNWEKDFRSTSGEAAAAVSPVGGYVMRIHLLNEAK